jgi:SAM-dependent methyltransferase
MTSAAARADLSVIKARQQKTWASGDYAVIASRIVLVSELLADAADLQAGWKVLDVACGNGNATLAAARCGTHALGIDYVPELLEGGRERAVAGGLDVEFRLGDTEDLPVADGSFDAALSVFGAMFAPDHQRAAGEIIRAARPAALSAWPRGPRTGSSARCSVSLPGTWPGRPASRRRCCGAPNSTCPTCSARRPPMPNPCGAPALGGSPPPGSSSRSSAAGTGRP